ncbi:hypothetical protein PSN45_005036 [Yamadazyma tenuis]|uniref:DUF676-domain-containing protein n=1 Tax=Candida tenuis (strain ATCC 10573 / BCRC 21748 / CBS 615 / JCM 9827 / NBRC 10315 / NRRL Y-1498 / VKM Y-70) TaxID=590646 RepID=G3B2K1_CANTC|nr:DUF676-domain-containing protein [Yamadazyma tenuis ATCC 10573]EGV64696.1 DUF676-domain-containing protein [Yamadazyma tenuis ATCC 10573]WEJ97483.1 hypothetical protein PSN45_005036 [Yamadazyma tenuis]
MVEYHLVVLVHGLWGTSSHMAYVKSQIEQEAKSRATKEKIVCYITGSHSGFLTHDGIDVNGKRICDEILAKTQDLTVDKDKVTKFSIVGYSLGGLISRYAVGYLYSIGFFDNIQPINFTSFCTPHVGALNPGTSWGTRIYNYISPYVLAHTGFQLFLGDRKKDKLPLLVWMSDHRSAFFKALSSFNNLVLYANVINDKRTAWYTAAISSRDPFKSMINENASAYVLEFVDGYAPNVVDISKPLEFKSELNDNVQPPIVKRGKRSLWRKFNWLKLIYAVVVFPLWILYALGLAGVQAFRNHRRVGAFFKDRANSLVHLYEGTKSDTDSDDWTLESFEKGVSQRMEDQTDTFVESVFTAMNGDSYKNYQASTGSTSGETGSLVNLSGKEQDFKLGLNEDQVTIINNLNKLNWNKFPVLIRKTKQTHRAAVYRTDDPAFSEGKVVVQQFAQQAFEF